MARMWKTCQECVKQGCCTCYRDDESEPPDFILLAQCEREALMAPFFVTENHDAPLDDTTDPMTRGVFSLPRKIPVSHGTAPSARL